MEFEYSFVDYFFRALLAGAVGMLFWNNRGFYQEQTKTMKKIGDRVVDHDIRLAVVEERCRLEHEKRG